MARDLYATLDLNLLKILVVLGQERNMRRAAERLFVTQPAVSQSLKKLRHHFDEELFIRTPKGLEPTEYTERLLSSIEPLLDELSGILNARSGIELENLTGTVRIAVAAHLSSVLDSALFESIHRLAPRLRVHVTNWSESSLRSLVNGELALGINMEIPDTPKEITMHQVALDRFSCFVRENHPGYGDREFVSPEDLDGVEVASIIVPDWNDQVPIFDRIMASRGYEARTVFRSDEPSAIADVIRNSDMAWPASQFISQRNLRGLHRLDLGIEEQVFNAPVFAWYHQKNRRSPVTQWVCSLVEEILAAAPGQVRQVDG